MANPNVNCLEGMRCPKCGSYGPFLISATCTLKVHDDGTDDQYNTEWDKDSWCQCCECDKQATVKSFNDPEVKK